MSIKHLSVCLLGFLALNAIGSAARCDEPRQRAGLPRKQASAAYAHDPINWKPDLFTAYDASVETNKPLLILVTATWCGPCKELKSKTFSDPKMAQFINDKFIPLQLDFEKDERIVKILEIEKLPCTVVLSPEADLLGRIVGSAEVAEYRGALEKTLQLHAKVADLRQTSAVQEQPAKR